MKQYLTLFISILLIQHCCFAQTGCKDSLNVSINSCSGTTYEPVCACDGKTYRNECIARNAGIVDFNWQPGPCELFDLDIVPNPVSVACSLNVFTKTQIDIQIWIFDMYYGQRYYRRYPSVMPGIPEQKENLDFRGYGNGIFFVVAEGAGEFKVKKILVNQIQ